MKWCCLLVLYRFQARKPSSVTLTRIRKDSPLTVGSKVEEAAYKSIVLRIARQLSTAHMRGGRVDLTECEVYNSGGNPLERRWYLLTGTTRELGGVLPDVETGSLRVVLGLWGELEKNGLYLLGTTARFRFGCTSDMMFQSTGEAWRMIGARVIISLLHELALLPSTVLDTDIRQVSMMSLSDRLLDLYGTRLLSGMSSWPLWALVVVCLTEV